MLRLTLIAVIAASLLVGAIALQDHHQSRRTAIHVLLQEIGADVDSSARALTASATAVRDTADIASARAAYEQLRRAYKRLEPFAEYVDAEFVTQWVNGAPLPRIDAKSQFVDILNPSGFQVIDELLHQEATQVFDSASRIRTHVTTLENDLRELTKEVQRAALTDRMLIEIARIAVMRVTAMGITGFDRPASDVDLSENAITLRVVSSIVAVFAEQCNERNIRAASEAAGLAQRGIRLFTEATHRDLDRADLIRDILDPLFGNLVDIQIALGIELASEVSPIPASINPSSRSMFTSSTLDPLVGTGLPKSLYTQETIDLGRALFFDPILSVDNDRACSSCHDPGKAFTDGQTKSLARGKSVSIDRNAPTLLNAVYARRFFTDLRAARLDDVIEHVITNEREFGSSVPMVLERLRQSAEYRQLFTRAFPRDGDDAVNQANIGRSIAAYLASLVRWNSIVDRYLRGERVTLSADVRRGFNLFMGNAACATCHFPPTFAGYVPPLFLSSESEILAVPSAPDTALATLDADVGRAGGILREHVAIYRNSFKTPTIRNVALTAPYMHNGVYPTLQDVLKFYDLGGGSGIGIDHPYQTLAADRLEFSTRDYDDLIAFMRALTDTVGTTYRPQRLPRIDNPALENRVIGGTY